MRPASFVQVFGNNQVLALSRQDGDGYRVGKENRRRKIEEFLDPILKNCLKLINPSNTLVVDESLLSFKGRVIFRQYLPAKPDKYGIKFFVVCDASTGAVCGAKCYVGKELDATKQRETKLNTKVVLDLVKPFANTGRCVVTDRYYTSPELAYELAKMNFDCVGTIQGNRRGLPKEFIALNLHKHYKALEKGKGKDANDDQDAGDDDDDAESAAGDEEAKKAGKVGFVFHDKLTLVKYEANAKKNPVHLLSTMHHTPEVSTKNGKPKVVEFYNSKKFGVDLLDQLVKNFSTKRTNRRWPMRVVFWALDVAAVQAFIAYRLANPDRAKDRRPFMDDLADGMMREQQSRRRRTNKSTHQKKVNRLTYAMRAFQRKPKQDYSMTMSQLKQTFEKPKRPVGRPAKRRLFDEPLEASPAKKSRDVGRKRCYFHGCDKKGKITCERCSKTACPDHRHNVKDGDRDQILCRECFTQ